MSYTNPHLLRSSTKKDTQSHSTVKPRVGEPSASRQVSIQPGVSIDFMFEMIEKMVTKMGGVVMAVKEKDDIAWKQI